MRICRCANGLICGFEDVAIRLKQFNSNWYYITKQYYHEKQNYWLYATVHDGCHAGRYQLRAKACYAATATGCPASATLGLFKPLTEKLRAFLLKYVQFWKMLINRYI